MDYYMCYHLTMERFTKLVKFKAKRITQEFTLEAVRKKLESIGISLDLDKLMNQQWQPKLQNL
jgi:hypothetical protein